MRILFRGALLALSICTPLSALAQVGSGSVAYNGGATEDFDSLASTGTSATLPTGWYFQAGSTTTYTANDGSANTTGSVYSYGSNGSGERAFGSMVTNALGSSGTVAARIGARLSNLTGATLTQLSVSYVGEVWQYQAATPDKLAFEYSVNASSLTDTGATWTAVAALDFNVPATVSGTGTKDGNLAANRAAVSATISGLSVANGASVWVRWNDMNISGVDNGLAIDDVVFGTPVDNPPLLANSVPANGANNVAITTEIDLQFSEAVTLTTGSLTLVCSASPQAFTASGSGNAYTITPNADLPYGSTCTLTIPAAAVVDQDGTPHPMDSDATVNFTTVADLAPTLSSSTPAEGSTTFPANGSLQLTFSEPVAVAGNWFTLVCSSSGTRNVADTVVSGGPTSFTINPNADFVQGESCALNLVAAQITDLDGNLDNYAGVATINFTPAAPITNVLPTVLSTTPMNNATTFPAAGDIVVLFSEPVTLATGAFSISCATTTNITLSHGTNGTSFTVSLDKVLVGGEACVFTIDRTKVTDGEGANPAQNTVVNFSVAASAAGNYYESVNDSDPQQLRCTLHEIIDGHTVYPYSAGTTDTWDILELADQAPGPGNENKVLDAYENALYARAGGGNTFYNREHTWPNSLGFASTSLAAYTDTHMLYLTNISYNSHRGNSPYDYCSSGCTRDATVSNFGVGGTSGAYPSDSNWYDANRYEVWNHRRGDMARAVMYMAIRYEGKADDTANDGDIPDLELTDNLNLVQITSNTAAKAYMGKLTTLLEWHQQDPPDQRELDRNGIVQGFQGNRNPFIDHPEWATMALFTSTQPATCVPGSANAAPNADDDSYNATEDTLLTVTTGSGVLVGDSDPEAAPITAVLLANALYGVVVMQTDGSFTYDPADDFCGTDTFTYRAYDGAKYSAAATVTVDVACINDAPVAVGTLANQTYPVGTAVNLPTAAAFDDIDNDVLSYSALGLPASLSIHAGTGVISGTLQAGDVAPPYAVIVTARDPSNAEVTQQFSLTVTPLTDDVFKDSFE